MKRTVTVLIGLLLISASWLSAQPDPDNKLAGHSSFGWTEPEVSMPGSDNVLEGLVQKRLDSRLSSMGYRALANGKPDFYVALHMVGEMPQLTLVIDIIDSESGLLVWRSMDSDVSGRSLWTARFTNYKTYAWKQIAALDRAPIFAVSDALLRNAISEELTLRDYGPSQATTTDMLVTYHVVGEGADARKPMNGTLKVDLIDRASNELLWQGRIAATIGDPEDREEQVRAVVKELFEELPAMTGTPLGPAQPK
jgi:hypothetical protein